MSDRTEEPDARHSEFHSGFKSQVVLFLALGCTSAGSLARYFPIILPKQMLVAGVFFGLSLAGLIYCIASLRNWGKRERSRREWMILAPVIAVAVALLVMRVVLLTHGNNV